MVNPNGTVEYTPAPNFNGTDWLYYQISDNENYTDYTYSTVTVLPVNDAPVVAGIPDQTIAEGASFVTINLDAYVLDIDNPAAQMTWSYSGNTALTVSILNRVATIGIPTAGWNGAETITFRATDPGALWGEDAATFTVTAVNDANAAALAYPELQVLGVDPSAEKIHWAARSGAAAVALPGRER